MGTFISIFLYTITINYAFADTGDGPDSSKDSNQVSNGNATQPQDSNQMVNFNASQLQNINQLPNFDANQLQGIIQVPNINATQMQNFNQLPDFDANQLQGINQVPNFNATQIQNFNQLPDFDANQLQGINQVPNFNATQFQDILEAPNLNASQVTQGTSSPKDAVQTNQAREVQAVKLFENFVPIPQFKEGIRAAQVVEEGIATQAESQAPDQEQIVIPGNQGGSETTTQKPEPESKEDPRYRKEENGKPNSEQGGSEKVQAKKYKAQGDTKE